MQVVSGGAGGVREDGRCGAEFDGAACDPNSAYFCCSAHGYCGGTGEHCSCDTCINYRPDSAGDTRLDTTRGHPTLDNTRVRWRGGARVRDWARAV